jgi:hypothetical protein
VKNRVERALRQFNFIFEHVAEGIEPTPRTFLRSFCCCMWTAKARSVYDVLDEQFLDKLSVGILAGAVKVLNYFAGAKSQFRQTCCMLYDHSAAFWRADTSTARNIAQHICTLPS